MADALPVEPHVPPSPLLAIDRNRDTVVERIAKQWGAELEKSGAGLDTDQLREMLRAMRADHLLAASLAGNLEGLRNIVAASLVGEGAPRASSPLAKALGDSNQDVVYVPVTPCRLVDTRAPYAAVYQNGGAFAPGEVRTYTVQGGNEVCLSQLPGSITPSAVQLSVFGIPTTSASGDIEILAQGSGFGSTATLVFLGSNAFTTASTTAQVNAANRQIGVQVRGGNAHVAIDVVGYFRPPAGGYVSSITAGAGFTGGTITSSGTIAADTTFLQRRVSASCAAGSSIRAINENGTVVCELDDTGGGGTVTSVGSGVGLTGGPITSAGTLSADTNYLQRRVSASCTAGSSIRSIGVDGSIACQGPANPTEIYVPAVGTPAANGAALAAALASITDSATRGYMIRLSWGTYQMAAPLQLQHGMTLQGGGRGHTRITASGIASVLAIVDEAEVELRDLAVTGTSDGAIIAIAGNATTSLTLRDVDVSVECTATSAEYLYVAGIADANWSGPLLRLYRGKFTVSSAPTATMSVTVGIRSFESIVRDSTITARGVRTALALDANQSASVHGSTLEAATTISGGTSAALRVGNDADIGPTDISGSLLDARGAGVVWAMMVTGAAMWSGGSILVSASRLRANDIGTTVFRDSNYLPMVVVNTQWQGAYPSYFQMKCFGNYSAGYTALGC